MAKLRKLFRPIRPKLKPCLFCGGKAQYINSTTKDIFLPQVYKTIKVGCPCGIYTREIIWTEDSDVQEVADIWNRRAKNG